MNKTVLKRLTEIKKIGLKYDINSDQHPWSMMFLLQHVVLEQQKRLDELEYKIAELRGEVEPDEE
jgi:hypothetical protein